MKPEVRRVLEKFAAVTGVDIVFYESEVDQRGDYVGANGFYRNGTVYLDVHAGAKSTSEKEAVLITAAHEFTHFIRENTPRRYNQLKEFVTEHLLENGYDFETLVERKIKAAQKDGGLSRDAAIEEVVADACEMVMGNSKAIERLAKEKPGLAKRIADWLHEFFADIRKAFEGVEARHEEAKAMLDYMDELTKLWDDALVEAAENRQKVKNTETKQSPRDYSYEALISKPDMKLTVVDSNVPNNRADIIALAKKNAASIGTTHDNGSVSVYVKDVKKEIILGTDGLKHSLDRRAETNAFITIKAGEILQNSIRINEITPQKKEAEAGYILIGAAINETNDLYIVRSVINRFSNELMSMDVLYAINAKKENRLRSMRPGFQGPVTDSTISISDLLDYVNKYFPDILPEDVLKHYGYDSRPEGKLGESALFSRRDSAEGLTKDEARAQAAAYTRLKAENAELQRRVEYWKGQTQRTKQATVRQTDVNRFARQLIKRYGSTADQAYIRQALQEMGDYLVQNNGEALDYNQLRQMAVTVSAACPAPGIPPRPRAARPCPPR